MDKNATYSLRALAVLGVLAGNYVPAAKASTTDDLTCYKCFVDDGLAYCDEASPYVYSDTYKDCYEHDGHCHLATRCSSVVDQ
jgi:hypothetical protein